MRFGPESRIVGIDDGPFARSPRASVLVLGVLMRGARIDGVVSTRVVRDGFGATHAIAAMLTTGRLAHQAQAVLLDGVAVGGFNLIDLPTLASMVGVPVVAVMRKMPNLVAMKQALSHTSRAQWRWRVVQRAGEIRAAGGLYLQVAGADHELAQQIVACASPFGAYPEPLRVAHLMAGGIVKGASRGSP